MVFGKILHASNLIFTKARKAKTSVLTKAKTYLVHLGTEKKKKFTKN